MPISALALGTQGRAISIGGSGDVTYIPLGEIRGDEVNVLLVEDQDIMLAIDTAEEIRLVVGRDDGVINGDTTDRTV